MRSSPTLSGYVKRLAIVGDLPHKSWLEYVKESEDGPVFERVEILEVLQEDVQSGVFKSGLKEVK